MNFKQKEGKVFVHLCQKVKIINKILFSNFLEHKKEKKKKN